jgi:hypothetical protein
VGCIPNLAGLTITREIPCISVYFDNTLYNEQLYSLTILSTFRYDKIVQQLKYNTKRLEFLIPTVNSVAI